MTSNEIAGYRKALENKALELSGVFQVRDTIAVESSAEDCERTVQANERDLAVTTLNINSAMLRLIRAALKRLNEGEYGECEGCEQEIPAKRLNAVPWARYCVRCQEMADQQGAEEFHHDAQVRLAA